MRLHIIWFDFINNNKIEEIIKIVENNILKNFKFKSMGVKRKVEC